MTDEEGKLPPSGPSSQTESEAPAVPRTSSSSTSTLSLGREDFVQTPSTNSFPVVNCPCGTTREDALPVKCEKCSAWHHAGCVGFDPTDTSKEYHCKDCKALDHEDTIDVVMTEPSLSPQDVTVSTTSTTARSPKRKRAPGRKTSSTLSRSTSPVTITMTEISENIVDNKVLYLMDALRDELLRKPFATKTSDELAPYRQKNFEFSDTIRMEFIQDLETAMKPVEVREVNHGKESRFAVYATEPLGPGLLVTEFRGQVRLVDSLLPETKKGVRVPQTLVLFPNAPRSDAWWETDEDLTLLAIDARKFGSLARYTRRSCRPNLSVKVVCVGVGERATLHFVLATSNVIAVGEELCLPLDFGDPYNDGLFFYDCACSQPELCLSPYARHHTAPPSSKKIQTNFKTETDSSTRSVAASSTSDLAATRKLSREERKMQRYIEFFEKMDRIEHKKEARRSGDNSAESKSSRRGSALVKGSMTSAESSSPPPPPKRRSLGGKKESSPMARSTPPTPPKDPINPKKAWLKAALQSLSQPSTPIVHDNDDLIDVVGGSSTPLIVPRAKKVTQRRKTEPPPPPTLKSPPPPPPPTTIKSPEGEPGEILPSPSPPPMTRPVYEDTPAHQQSPPQIPQRRGFELPLPLEDRYARINRPSLIDDRHPRAFTSPDRRTSNFAVEETRPSSSSSRWDDQGFSEQQRPDRRSFDQHRKFHDDMPSSHPPRTTSTTGTSSNVSSPSPWDYTTPRDAYSHQSREHRFHSHDRSSQQQHRQDRQGYSHPQYPGPQRRRGFSGSNRDEDMGRGGRDYDELPSSQQRSRFEEHFRGQSPPPPPTSRRAFDGFGDRRSPQYRPRNFFPPPEESQRFERGSNRFTSDMPSGSRHHQEGHAFPSETSHANAHSRPSIRDPERRTSDHHHDTDMQQ